MFRMKLARQHLCPASTLHPDTLLVWSPSLYMSCLEGRRNFSKPARKRSSQVVFSDSPTLFLATSVQRKAVGIVHAPGDLCSMWRDGVHVCGRGHQGAASRLHSESKPASGLGDSASMLPPKGDRDREVGGALDLWGLNRGAMGKGEDGSRNVSHLRAGRA